MSKYLEIISQTKEKIDKENIRKEQEAKLERDYNQQLKASLEKEVELFLSEIQTSALFSVRGKEIFRDNHRVADICVEWDKWDNPNIVIKWRLYYKLDGGIRMRGNDLESLATYLAEYI